MTDAHSADGPPAADEPPPRLLPVLLQRQYLAAIRDGRKTVEGRVRTSKYAAVRPGDVLLLIANEDERETLAVTVLAVRPYDSFEAMLRSEGVGACLPGVSDVAAGVEIYRSFPRYAEGEGEHGVVAFAVEAPVAVADGGGGGGASAAAGPG